MSGDSHWASGAFCSAVLKLSWWVAAVSVLSACRAPDAQEPGSQAPLVVPTTQPPELGRMAPPPDSPNIEPGPERALGLGAPVEIRSATGLVSLPTQHFTETQTRSSALAVRDVSHTWLALDERAPRRATDAPLVLAHLINEDEELAPGFHRLFAFERNETELLFEQKTLTVETPSTGQSLAPGCVLFLPRGTYNGRQATERVEVVVVPLQREVDRVEIRVQSGSFVASGSFLPRTQVWIEGAPDGDLEVSVTCLEKQEALTQLRRTIVLNGDTEPGDTQ